MQEPIIPSPMVKTGLVIPSDFGWQIFVTSVELSGKSDSWSFRLYSWLWAYNMVHGSYFGALQYHRYCSTSIDCVTSITQVVKLLPLLDLARIERLWLWWIWILLESRFPDSFNNFRFFTVSDLCYSFMGLLLLSLLQNRCLYGDRKLWVRYFRSMILYTHY